MVAQVGRVLMQIENNYVDPVDRARLVEGAMKGMVEELDPHSQYMPPQDFSIFQSETEGQFGGVGIEVESRGDLLTVVAPIEGSPAERAGIRSGDVIVAIDDEDISRTPLDKLVRRMRGAPGSRIRLTVRRNGENDLRTFNLVRQVVHVPSVASRLLDNAVAYVHVKQFQEHTHDELLGAAGKLRAQSKGPIRGVLLDLRSDPGGLVDEAAEIADEFLASGTIYTTRHRGQIVDEVKASAGGAFSDLPTVVLVNEYSASAAELVAGALQDQKRALVVGANTFGKGSVQTILDLPGGAGIRLTTARYYTPSGHSLQAEGIHPDILVELHRDPAAAALPAVHERDLEGHLSALGAQATAAGSLSPPAASPVYREPANAAAAPKPSEPSVEGSDAQSVPRDPTSGSDFALRIAYQALRGTLPGHDAPP
jgi:carboxyl-terminal processing protease